MWSTPSRLREPSGASRIWAAPRAPSLRRRMANFRIPLTTAGLKLCSGRPFDCIRERVRKALVAEVAHMQAVTR
jgi:hypothetical protein